MAGPDDKKPRSLADDPQLKANMGKYLNRAKPVNDQLKPGQPVMPKAPGVPGKEPEIQYEKQGGTGLGKAPPFPIVASQSLGQFEQAKQTDADTFGLEQDRAFDPELNELALKEVAAARGMTVEQLLESRADRKTDVKLRPAEIAKEAPVQQEQAPPRSFLTPEDEEMLHLENRMAELKNKASQQPAGVPTPESVVRTAADIQKTLVEREHQSRRKREERAREEEKPGVPKEFNDNPVIAKLRKKLSIQAIEPCQVTIEDVKFEMLPAPANLNLWILEKIQASESVVGGGAPLALAIKLATVCASLTKIEGVDVAEVLDIPQTGDDFMTSLACAQSLWEMMIGLPSRQDLFELDPELGVKLYEPYLATFGNRDLKSSFQEQINRFVCPVEGCMEMYDMKPMPSGISPFCKVHGGPMEDKGLIKELRSVPLA